MIKFILKTFYLIAPLALFILYMEFNLSKIPNSYSIKRKYLEKNLDSIEVLVLGSSQATYGVNPDFFKLKGFNLSNISQSLYYDTRLALNYVDKMPRLKYIIINVSYFSFGTQIADGLEKWRDYYYTQFWDINFPELDRYNLKRYSKIFLYTPKTALSFLVKGFHVNLTKGFQENGYLKSDTTSNRLKINSNAGRKRVMFHDKFYKESRFSENQNDLELLVRELTKRNIIPVIVTPPVLSTYYNFANQAILKKNGAAINTICLKYKCEYFNYFTDSRFVINDFKDNDHMNFIGAEKFSKILNDEILNKKSLPMQTKEYKMN
jgi:hypothetical protein